MKDVAHCCVFCFYYTLRRRKSKELFDIFLKKSFVHRFYLKFGVRYGTIGQIFFGKDHFCEAVIF